jgi:hypothetical protein
MPRRPQASAAAAWYCLAYRVVQLQQSLKVLSPCSVLSLLEGHLQSQWWHAEPLAVQVVDLGHQHTQLRMEVDHNLAYEQQHTAEWLLRSV